MKRKPKSLCRAARLCTAAITIATIGAKPVLAAEESVAFQPALLDVSINQQRGKEPVLVLRRGDDVYVTAETMAAWRLKIPAPATVTFEGEKYVSLASFKGLTFTLLEETQTLEVSVAPDLLKASVLSLDRNDGRAMTPSSLGAFFNYDLLGQYADGVTDLNGAFELGLFGGFGFATSTFVAGVGGRSLTRLDTNWTMDDPDRLRSIRVGDSISRGGTGGAPVRFGGLQFGSNFAVQPGFVTIPLPTVKGSAALPSVVDIYVNNSLRETREIAPGPFSITDVPIVTGSGDVQLIVRDVLGRETLISRPYYAAPQLLRRGLHDYSYEAGFLRRHHGMRSNDYGAMMVSGTHRYGFTDNLTGEFHFEATQHTQAAGASGIYVLEGLGLLEASLAGSASSEGTGGLVGFGFERRTRGISLGARSEFTTKDYRNVSSAPARQPAKKTLQLSLGMPVDFGSIGATYLLRDGRSEPDAEILSANASFRLGQLGTAHLVGRKSFRGERETAIELLFTLPIGRRRSGSSGIRRRSNRTSATIDFLQNLPSGDGFGYRLSAAMGEVDRISANVNAQSAIGTYQAEVGSVNGKAGARITAAGSLATIGGTVFAARKLHQSFATVQVGEFSNVGVYADNQLVGKTNSKGLVVVPRLRPFESNRIRIELADLPMDATVGEGEQSVRPHNRSGVAVAFDVKRSRGALLSIVFENGAPLPAGSAVRLNGQTDEFLAAPGGEVYLSGLGSANTAYAHWEGRTCQFNFEFPETDDPQPNLGRFICTTE